MKCADIERLLPDFLDEMLSISQRRSVEDHLETCESCAQELGGHRRALVSLERVSLEPGPDLWQAFSQRMAAEITCREVREALPAYHDGALGATLAVSVHNHLRSCGGCAVEAEKLAAALDMLERVGEAAPQVDLWAAFVERREAEARRPAGVFSRLAAAFRSAWSSPGFQPAFSLGVLALCVLSGRQLLLTTHTDALTAVAVHAPTEVAAPTRVEPRAPVAAAVPDAPNAPEVPRAIRPKPAVSRKREVAAVARPRPRRTVRVARAETRVRPARPVAHPARKPAERLIAAVEAPVRGVWTSQLQVSYNMPEGAPASEGLAADAPPAPVAPAPREGELFKKAVVVNSGRAQAEVMPEVVEAVRLLAGIEDATRNPFRTAPNAR